tara:strand:- start:55 stop:339 length:285 start_codon:yes stop_codon:yes gene_type:complete
MNSNIRKNKSRNTKNNNKRDTLVIIKINPDELVYKNEDEIRFISDKMNKNLRIARSQKDDVSIKTIEKEICYVQRELRYRESRRKAHEKFYPNR